MTVAAQQLQSKPHIGCFAHTLNLAAHKALKIDTVSRLLGKVRRIVGYFHRSTTAAALLKAKVKLLGLKELKLKQDVPTRWNSAADMLERYLHLQPAIYATLVSNELNTRESDISTLSETDTRQAINIMECLLPLREMTNAICTEKTPTVSIVLPLLQKVQAIMAPKDTDQPIVRQIKAAVTDNLSTRYSSEEITNFLGECTVLDPKFKNSYFESDRLCTIFHRLPFLCSVGGPIKVKAEPTETVQATRDTSVQLPETPQLPTLPMLPQLPVGMDLDNTEQGASTSADLPADESLQDPVPVVGDILDRRGGLATILDDVDVAVVKEEKGSRSPLERATEEINRYKELPQISVVNNPLMWWEENSVYFPFLSNLVKSRLCIPATSVPSERIFSTAGDIVTAQRATLNSEMVDKLIFLKKNCV